MTITIKTVFYYKGNLIQVQAYRIDSYKEYLKLWKYYKNVLEGKIQRDKDESCWELCKGDEEVIHETSETGRHDQRRWQTGRNGRRR